MQLFRSLLTPRGGRNDSKLPSNGSSSPVKLTSRPSFSARSGGAASPAAVAAASVVVARRSMDGPLEAKPGFFRKMQSRMPRLNLASIDWPETSTGTEFGGGRAKDNLQTARGNLEHQNVVKKSYSQPEDQIRTERIYCYSMRGYRSSSMGPAGSLLTDRRNGDQIRLPRTKRGSIYGDGSTSLGRIIKAFSERREELSLKPIRKTFHDMPIQMNDEDAVAIAGLLARDTCVKRLTVHDANFGSIGAQAISEALRENTTLVALELRQCGIESQGILAIAASLGSVGLCTNNTTLTELGVTRNRMGNFGLACLAKALKTNTSLRSLDISDDPTIQEEGFCELFLSLERNTTLDKLACKIMKPWPNAMGAMSRLLAGGLTSVCLSGSILGEVGIDLLVAALASEQEKRHSLTNLDLSKCHMESEGATILGKALATNTYLQHLNIANNNLLLEGAHAVATGLVPNKALISIDISANDIGDIGAGFFAQVLLDVSLKSLNLSDNFITCSGAQALAIALADSEARLEKLDVSKNKIECPGLSGLAIALKRNRRLRSLNVNDNELSVPSAMEFAASISVNNVIQELVIQGLGKEAAVAMCEAIRSLPRPPGFKIDGAGLCDAAQAMGYPQSMWTATDKAMVKLLDGEGADRMIAFAMGAQERLGPASMRPLGGSIDVVMQHVGGYDEKGPLVQRDAAQLHGKDSSVKRKVLAQMIKKLCWGEWEMGVARTSSLDTTTSDQASFDFSQL